MRKVKKVKYIIIAFLLWFAAVIVGGGGIATADTVSGYTNVAEDLQKDESFNAWDYPAVPTDYKIEVIQIAESTSDELFIYVYQPSGKTQDFKATCINMSLTEETTDPTLYTLKFLNSSGVFYKYLVQGVKVSSDETRYYNITSIYRPWVEGIDTPTGNDNTIDEVVFEVGKLFTATTISNGGVNYQSFDIETINVTEKYVDFIRYTQASVFFVTGKCDSHYIAFSTNRRIETLCSAKVSFVKTPCTEINNFIKGSHTFSYGDPEPREVVLSDSENVTVNATWLWGNDKKFCRIESVNDFKKHDEVSDEIKTNLVGKDWVLRFYESPYVYSSSAGVATKEYEIVGEETILWLDFKTAGKHYSLGVVDNKQSGDLIPGNDTSLKWWQILLIVIGCLIVVLIVFKLLSLVFPVFGAIFQALWFVVTSPVRLIVWIVKKIRGE